ncbi:hypothetical protein Syun_024073 [Stephania yunnanensis]|uniref:Uncharacterized protein n=1 Tax=Stephania yunnanensis TaxID=152371 RepID=A0AAP0FKP4_9MAGN
MYTTEGVFSLNSLTVASSSCCSFLDGVTTNDAAASTSARNSDRDRARDAKITSTDSATELSESLATNSFPKFDEPIPPLAVRLARRRERSGDLGTAKLGFRLRWRKIDLVESGRMTWHALRLLDLVQEYYEALFEDVYSLYAQMHPRVRPTVLVLAFEELVTSYCPSMEIDGKEVKAQIWDTARHDRPNSVKFVLIKRGIKIIHGLIIGELNLGLLNDVFSHGPVRWTEQTLDQDSVSREVGVVGIVEASELGGGYGGFGGKKFRLVNNLGANLTNNFLSKFGDCLALGPVETSKRDDGIDLLKDNQALRAPVWDDEKAKMDLSSLTQTNISLMEHTAVLVDEMMSLGSNLMDVNVALIKAATRLSGLSSPSTEDWSLRSPKPLPMFAAP